MSLNSGLKRQLHSDGSFEDNDVNEASEADTEVEGGGVEPESKQGSTL